MMSQRDPLWLVCWGVLALLVVVIWTGCGGGGGGGGGSQVAVTLTAAPEGARLQWTSQNATTVVQSNFGAGTVNGLKDIYPTTTTTYTITVSDGSSQATDSVTVRLQNKPPAPQPGGPGQPFAVHTDNYYYLYTGDTAPFPASYQLTDGQYPASCSYETLASPPAGFDLKTEAERSVTLLSQADPRISIISGVDPSVARIKVSLVEDISYNGQSNIIGLTKVTSGPYYDVSVATIDPANGGPMPFYEMQRVLTHELGHAFGLGHAPDTHDLMYYQSNHDQGGTPATFVTLGDAAALWATLNAQSIVWHPDRPPITQSGGGTMVRRDSGFRHKRVTDEGGIVILERE